MLRGDRPFQILEKIIDKPTKWNYQVSMILVLHLMYLIFLCLM